MLLVVRASANLAKISGGSVRTLASTAPIASEAMGKFKVVLKDYRLANFHDAWPKRYAKAFMRGVDKNHDDFLEKEDFSSFLNVIGASDKLTPDDLDQVMKEIIAIVAMPENTNHVPVEKMIEMMLEGIERGEM